MDWRPREGWGELWEKAINDNISLIRTGSYARTMFEAGANAMLEALKAQTIDIEVEPWYRTIHDQVFKPSGVKSKGKLIFIPDN